MLSISHCPVELNDTQPGKLNRARLLRLHASKNSDRFGRIFHWLKEDGDWPLDVVLHAPRSPCSLQIFGFAVQSMTILCHVLEGTKEM